jgi:hypothetical protein
VTGEVEEVKSDEWIMGYHVVCVGDIELDVFK